MALNDRGPDMAKDEQVPELGESRRQNEQQVAADKERQRAELVQSTLYKIAIAATQAKSLDELYKSIHQYLDQLLDTTNFYIALHQRDDTFSFPYCVDQYEEGVEFVPQDLKKSLTAYVFRTQTPLLADEKVHEELIKRGKADLVGTPSKIWLGVPLKTDRDVIGVIVLQSYTDSTLFSEKDLEMLNFVSMQIAWAIERKQYEEALQKSEELLRTVINAAHEAIIAIGEDGLITLFNPAAEKMFGRSKDEILGQPLDRLMPEEYREHHGQYVKDYFSKGIPHDAIDKVIELPALRSTGEIFPMEISLAAGKRANEKFVVGVARDITRRKQVEEEKLQLEDRLRQVQKMEAIGNLSSGVAHDFNNLLTVINGNAEAALMKLQQNHPLHKHFNAIHRAGKRAEDLTRQLLSFSRKQIFAAKNIDINRVIGGFSEMMRRLIGEDIHVEMLLEQGLPPINADPGQIEQILVNLVVNARDALMGKKPADKKITIETCQVYLDEAFTAKHPGSSPGLHVLLLVSDNGIGMDAETKRKIFEPFFTTKEKGKGTGLGMSTVYGIVKQNNGSIYVYSEPDQGSAIKIYWPSTTGKKSPETTVPIEAKKDEITGRERILIVEDEASVRDFAAETLTDLGYEVFQAENGKKALELIQEKKMNLNLKVDLLFTDLVMPEMNGRELAVKLKALFPEIGILYSSGYTYHQLLHNGALEKGTQLIHKPYSVRLLAEKVREVLDKKSFAG
ncbi:MAG: PAS domain S-box protein [Candidatus Aminicenantes bacterium]|jgi:PAS domain S-box-containing protein